VIENHISSSILLQIDYNHENDVALGNNLTPQQTNHQPKVTFVVPPEEQNAYYTLVMVILKICTTKGVILNYMG
jgi:hypothetical protein